MTAEAAGTPAPPRRILLVEDDRFQRKAAEAKLRARGFDVLVAEDGEEALRAVAGPVRPDLILLDLIMPKLSGFEVLRRLKEDPATAGIPVIVLSNLGQKSDIERATAEGAVDYLVKATATLRDLITRVETILAGTRP